MSQNLETQILIRAGVRNLDELNRLIDTLEATDNNVDELRRASERLSNEWDGLSTDERNRRLEAFNSVIRDSSTDVNQLSNSTQVADNDFKSLSKTLAGFAGAYVGIDAVASGIRELIETSKKLDSLNQKLEYATGSAEETEIVWGKLKDMANELGLEQMDLGNGYAQLASATKNLNISQEETMGVFRGVAEATAAMSLTADESNGVFLALSQIASKGKVSMEELRGQLGERLTPAMGIAAKAMGVTTAELESMVESGINAKEFLPKFGTALSLSAHVKNAHAHKLCDLAVSVLDEAGGVFRLSMPSGEYLPVGEWFTDVAITNSQGIAIHSDVLKIVVKEVVTYV